MPGEPMTTETNGRFQPGNQAAVGHSSRSQKLRHSMLQAITPADLQAVIAKLIDLARSGDLRAAALLFSVVGKPSEQNAVQAKAVATPGEPLNSERIREIVERVRSQRQTETSNQPAT